MKNHRIRFAMACVAAAAAGSWSLPSMADDLQLATAKNCMACHAVEKKLVGPSYKDIAAKYAGQADAGAKLEAKVLKGGSGVWGPVPMPANSQLTPAEAKQLIAWVLAQK